MGTKPHADELGPSRLLIIGGIVLIAAGMIFGDVFAVFVLHQNADKVGEALSAATEAVAAKDTDGVAEHFENIGDLLENRGTKVDAHVHAIDFGYLALLLALLQPFVALGAGTRKHLAQLFLTGAVMLPVSVFLIHYVGLSYSPLSSIGWASIFADLGGLLVIIACAGELAGLWRHARGARESPAEAKTPPDRTWASRALLFAGTLLILAGFIHGAFYAAFYLQRHEAQDQIALETMISTAVAQQNATPPNMRDAQIVVQGYGEIQAEKAVNIAAHSHIIEFGLLAILLAFIQPFVFLAERWKRLWVVLMLTGSVMLPVFVLLELKLGLVAGGIADFGGLLVIIGLIGMLAGIRRNNVGRAQNETQGPSNPRRLLVISGVVLAVWGMSFGLFYALFAEHQALDKIGSSLAEAFTKGAAGDLFMSRDLVQTYAEAQFAYVRRVDVHSHWTGLAMLLIVFGLMFDRVDFTEKRRTLVAWMLVAGAVLFPLGVLLQTADRGFIPQTVAAVGAALVVVALAAIATSLARLERN
ncbi:MAG TPA: hypothetical protein VFB82_19295 [Blastocatellia bacterium]|nr:hypothetical protein [Blastocatellia bacterium]